MNLIVWGIVGGVNHQNSIVNAVCADDWAAESAIKASNGAHYFHPLFIICQPTHYPQLSNRPSHNT